MTNTLTIGEKIARDLCEMDPPAGDSIEVDPVDVARRIDDFASTLAAQIELLRDGLKRADDLLRTSYDHVSPLIREALSTTPDQALEQFAAKVRDQCFDALDPDKYPNECDKSMVHNCRLSIRAIKDLP